MLGQPIELHSVTAAKPDCRISNWRGSSLRPPKCDVKVLALDVAGLPQPLAKAGHRRFDCARECAGEKADHWCRLLRARRARPRSRTRVASWRLLLRPSGHTLPHRCTRTPLCITAKIAR
jgi:hypothetical protein